jgi:methylated-DNA-[protein]-cysteine S-methyltransferase
VTRLSYAELDSPMGTLLLVGSERGLIRLGLPVEPPDQVLGRLEDRTGTRAAEEPARVDVARRQMDQYFAGRRREFTLPLDLSLASGFRLRSLEAMFEIPYGETISYGELASRAGNPRAFRAAGHACATNPIPIVLPCHRVVRSDGDLNWYTGGLRYKELLLSVEGVPLTRRGDRPRVAVKET